MTVKVFPKEGPKIRLWLPTGVLKWRILYSALNKRSKASFDFKTLRFFNAEGHQGIGRFIRRHGHFNLVEVKSSGTGTYVLIRLINNLMRRCQEPPLGRFSSCLFDEKGHS
jgi:hypothetical protein